jgi:hypothetical protein
MMILVHCIQPHLAGCSAVHFGRDREQGRGGHATHGGSQHARGQEGGAQTRRVLCGGRASVRHVCVIRAIIAQRTAKLFTTLKVPNLYIFTVSIVKRQCKHSVSPSCYLTSMIDYDTWNRTDLDSLVKNFVPALIDPVLGDYVRNVANARDAEVLSLFATIINKIGGRCVLLSSCRVFLYVCARCECVSSRTSSTRSAADVCACFCSSCVECVLVLQSCEDVLLPLM